MRLRDTLSASTMVSRSASSVKKGVRMVGLTSGSAEASLTDPSFDLGRAQMAWIVKPSGWFRVADHDLAMVDMPSGVIDLVARKRSWTSGDDDASPESVSARVRKPPWSQPGDVSGPFRAKSHLAAATGFVAVVPGMRSAVECDLGASAFERFETRHAGWSWRFLPTPGRSATTGMPSGSSSDLAPTPESMRICGEPMAPAVTRTSAAALFATSSVATASPSGFVRRRRSSSSVMGSTIGSSPGAVRRTSTPVARCCPSKTTRFTTAPCTTSRFGRSRTALVM
mmetsp:Transcript_23150/g.91849  ORF Transcript_23150/g.91849 Transcript_23150/m.91849 type:complete len:283 (+) Transcript_23150:769-1617(+)